MHLEFQIIDNPCRFAQAARLSSLYWPEDPIDADRLASYASEFPEDKFSKRVLAFHGEQPVAYVRLMQAYWYADQTRCNAGIAVPRTPHDPDIFAQCLEWSNEEAARKGMATLSFNMRSDDHHLIQILAQRGFEKGQVNPVSVLEIEAYPEQDFAGAIEKVVANGYEILDLHGLVGRYPDDWKTRLYDWDMTVTADVPMPGEFEAIPFETYVKMIESPTVSREAHYMAIKDDLVVAASELNWNTIDRTIANTGLTGVRREHRRQGIATAVKAATIAWAKSAGIKRIYTDNEENNPMYGLNLALGFRRVHDLVDYYRSVW